MIQILEQITRPEIVALTIIGEARGEPIEGQVAVGNVIRNRVLHSKKTYHEVCLAPFQFSCWNENDPNYVILMEIAQGLLNGATLHQNQSYNQCYWVAQGIIDFSILDNTGGALFYIVNSTQKRPEWMKTAYDFRIYGHQTFFKLNDTSFSAV